MKLQYLIIGLIIVTSSLAYDYDVSKPVKTPRALSSKVLGGNDDAQLPYRYYPFAMDIDKQTGVRTIYYHITNDYGQPVTDLTAWISPGESLYLLKQRIEIQIWIEYEYQAGDIDNALQYYIRNFNARGLVCE